MQALMNATKLIGRHSQSDALKKVMELIERCLTLPNHSPGHPSPSPPQPSSSPFSTLDSLSWAHPRSACSTVGSVFNGDVQSSEWHLSRHGHVYSFYLARERDFYKGRRARLHIEEYLRSTHAPFPELRCKGYSHPGLEKVYSESE